MFKITQKGNFKSTEKLLTRPIASEVLSIFHRHGRDGVIALASATPVDSGSTSRSWAYEIRQNRNNIQLVFTNSNRNKGANVAILIQYGHATGTGGYVPGRDYINPAIRPIFNRITESIKREVEKL